MVELAEENTGLSRRAKLVRAAVVFLLSTIILAWALVGPVVFHPSFFRFEHYGYGVDVGKRIDAFDKLRFNNAMRLLTMTKTSDEFERIMIDAGASKRILALKSGYAFDYPPIPEGLSLTEGRQENAKLGDVSRIMVSIRMKKNKTWYVSFISDLFPIRTIAHGFEGSDLE